MSSTVCINEVGWVMAFLRWLLFMALFLLYKVYQGIMIMSKHQILDHDPHKLKSMQIPPGRIKTLIYCTYNDSPQQLSSRMVTLMITRFVGSIKPFLLKVATHTG